MASYFLYPQKAVRRIQIRNVGISKTYMSLIETILSIFLIPSQCKTSGMRAWKRMSLTPAMSSVDLKYLSAESPPRLRKLYTRYLSSGLNPIEYGKDKSSCGRTLLLLRELALLCGNIQRHRHHRVAQYEYTLIYRSAEERTRKIGKANLLSRK